MFKIEKAKKYGNSMVVPLTSFGIELDQEYWVMDNILKIDGKEKMCIIITEAEKPEINSITKTESIKEKMDKEYGINDDEKTVVNKAKINNVEKTKNSVVLNVVKAEDVQTKEE